MYSSHSFFENIQKAEPVDKVKDKKEKGKNNEKHQVHSCNSNLFIGDTGDFSFLLFYVFGFIRINISIGRRNILNFTGGKFWGGRFHREGFGS